MWAGGGVTDKKKNPKYFLTELPLEESFLALQKEKIKSIKEITVMADVVPPAGCRLSLLGP